MRESFVVAGVLNRADELFGVWVVSKFANVQTEISWFALFCIERCEVECLTDDRSVGAIVRKPPRAGFSWFPGCFEMIHTSMVSCESVWRT